jgi:HEAT repeat protein
MQDESGFVRSGAAWALGNIGGEEVIEPLKNALNDKSSYVRKVAEKFLDNMD